MIDAAWFHIVVFYWNPDLPIDPCKQCRPSQLTIPGDLNASPSQVFSTQSGYGFGRAPGSGLISAPRLE
jgi:hypothetical protein